MINLADDQVIMGHTTHYHVADLDSWFPCLVKPFIASLATMLRPRLHLNLKQWLHQSLNSTSSLQLKTSLRQRCPDLDTTRKRRINVAIRGNIHCRHSYRGFSSVIPLEFVIMMTFRSYIQWFSCQPSIDINSV